MVSYILGIQEMQIADEIAHADGTLSTLVAVKPARFKRLQLASEQLVRNAQHIAGLNPRAFRLVPPFYPIGSPNVQICP
jgi:hypothetical protein